MSAIKCVVVGDGAVGKTCFVMTVNKKAFPADSFIPTVFNPRYNDQLDPVDIDDSHTVELPDGRQASITFWDTAGQEDFDRLRPTSYPDTNVFLVCFSVDMYDSFENIRHKWILEITHYCPNTPWLLVGMKSDLRTKQDPGHRMVEKNEAVQLAKDLGAFNYYECSSLEVTGLDDIVQAAVSTALDYVKPRRRNVVYCDII